MLPEDDIQSLGDAATFAGAAKRRSTAEMSLGDQQTLGGGDRSGQDTVIDDIEVVDLEARYKVEGTLGQGGMGAVLLATDTRLDRKVAIKRILGEAAGNRMAVQRFLTEAKAIAALNHPNIVQIYDYGRAKDGPFLIMEYVDGGSLLDRCRESALPLEEAIDLACQLCDGLAKAHDLKIIHRDIKPANVLLTRDGVPKLTDFGLAKAEAGDHGQTMTGAVLGTPDFMPPEQRRDASLVDHRSDLWSLAATVYQMVTGRSPKIIRFDLLPAELTKVLGKALEDAKDARYQSARELRDALKTGLRTAAAVEELIEGACPACGVKNESSRRFCRGCGESLEAECLSCTKAMPMWEEICGSCGAKQAPLVAERRESMAARQAEAEGLLGDFEFDRAAAIAAELRDEPHRRLRHLTSWAATFLGEVEKSRADQTRHAAEAMAEAAKHEAAYDYLSAAFTLESIPQSLRIGPLPGASEPVATALERVKSRQKQARALESKVKARLASKNLDDLLPTVERLLELQPDRPDVQKLRTQLRDRNEKLIAAGAAAFREAQALLDTHDYEGAVAALTPLKGVARSIEVEALQEQATGLLARTRDLIQRIREAVAAKRFEGLFETVEKYLTLKPADEEIQRLRQSLIERENRVLDEIAKRLEKARNHEQACRFDDAAKILSGIPESRRSADIESCLERSERLAHLREKALTVLSRCKAGEYGAALEQGTSYRTALASARFTDEQFDTLWAKAETAHADEVQVKRLVRAAVLAATGIAAAIVLAAAGLWIRSTIRATTLAEAIAQSRWDDALAIEPESVAALVGRARQKLESNPADIDGAFADLDRAGGGGETSLDLRRTRADGHALRSRQQVRNERLEEAGQDFAEAKRLGASAELLATAQEALVAAWAARAQSASEKSDLSRLQTAIAAGLAAGASRERLLEVWETYAVRRIAELDVKGVQQACREGERFGLSGETQVRWWLEIAKKAAQPPREDLAVLKLALEAAKAAGAVEERLLAVWETYAAGRIAELDVTGLKQAGEEGEKLGLSGEKQARWWLEIAEKATQPPREDLAVLKLALEAAKEAGAVEERLLAVWETYAAGRIAELDATGLKQACEEGGKFGLSGEKQARWWLEIAEKAAQPPREDLAVLKMALEAATGAGAVEERLLPVWETYAAGRIAELDVTGLKQACEDGGKLGLSGETQVRWWLKIAQNAAQPPREDLAVLKLALEAAKAAGASKETLAAPQSRQLLLEAGALVAAGDMRSATARAIEATFLDISGVAASLKQPANQALREAVLGDYRSRFDTALSGGDWDSVLRTAAAAGAIDNKASGWLSIAITEHPDGLAAVPAEMLGRLPVATLAGLPPATVAALPSATLAALPPATLAALPPATRAVLPRGVITALPPIRNSIGIELKLIPPGRFTMGQPDETPHRVTLTKAFYIGVYEVTNAQWTRVMGSVTSQWQDADRPVELVSWEDAVEFCRKLSALPAERQAGREYRLPTEAEWEYACRAGTDTKYSFGDDESKLGEYGWFEGNSGYQTRPVGQKKPNAWGLFDMHGNVTEWCSDWYGEYPKGAVTDPQGPSGASDRVRRGGCWVSSARHCRSARRYGLDPSDRFNSLGFRLALSPSGVSTIESKPDGKGADTTSLIERTVEGKPPPDTVDDASVRGSPEEILARPPLVNSIGVALKLLPAGTFTMGQGGGGPDETPHTVTLTKPFYIGVHEVTNAQWKQVMGSMPSRWADDQRPVEQVSWEDAVMFCTKLSAMPEERRRGREYRLPTEAEWEYACRGGTETRYSFGDDVSKLSEYAWFADNSTAQTHPVGRKKPNPWGLYDLHGNVHEWCSDWYENYVGEPARDPQGPREGEARVRRGSCWNAHAKTFQSNHRFGDRPALRINWLGFRIALNSPSVSADHSEAVNANTSPSQLRAGNAQNVPAAVKTQERVAFLTDLHAKDVKVNHGLGTGGKDGYGNRPISIKGKSSEKAIRMHPHASGPATASYDVPRGFTHFRALAAIDDGAKGEQDTALVFKVYGDNRELWRSKSLKAGHPGETCFIAIADVEVLKIVVECPGPDHHAWAVWVDPCFCFSEEDDY